MKWKSRILKHSMFSSRFSLLVPSDTEIPVSFCSARDEWKILLATARSFNQPQLEQPGTNKLKILGSSFKQFKTHTTEWRNSGNSPQLNRKWNKMMIAWQTSELRKRHKQKQDNKHFSYAYVYAKHVSPGQNSDITISTSSIKVLRAGGLTNIVCVQQKGKTTFLLEIIP